MRTRVIINWDDDDPFPMGKRVEEAFNRVINFCPELLVQANSQASRSPEQAAWRRVVSGEFEQTDLGILVRYARTLVQRIKEKYEGSAGPVPESIVQAADNLYVVISETVEYVVGHLA